MQIADTLLEIKGELDEFHVLLDREMKYFSVPTMAKRYVEADRPGRALARFIRSEGAGADVVAVRNYSGDICLGQEAAIDAFLCFYEALYSKRPDRKEAENSSFLGSLPMSALSPDAAAKLDAPFTIEDIAVAIDMLSKGKSRGTDMLGAEFYTKIQRIAVPPYVATMGGVVGVRISPNVTAGSSNHPSSETGQTSLECDSYCPLSLLNVNTKIFAKVIATYCSLPCHSWCSRIRRRS